VIAQFGSPVLNTIFTSRTNSDGIQLFRPNVYCWFFFTLDAGLLARSQYPEGTATGHRDTGFSWFPCA